MDSDRDERMRQRLRGSQRRQIKDVDFGLSFPALSQQAAASQATPQPELPAQLSNRRTPGSRGRGRPSNAALAEVESKPPTHSASNANISAKRRKLDSDDAPAPSSSTRSTRSSLHQPRADIYALPEDDEQNPPAADTTNEETTNDSIEQTAENGQLDDALPASTSVPRLRSARTPSLPARMLEEVTESPTDAPGSGHRTRVGFNSATLQSLQLQDVLQAEDSTPIRPAETGSPVPQIKRKRAEATPKQITPAAKRLRRGPRSQIEAADELDELSPAENQSTGRLPLPAKSDLDELSPESSIRRSRRSHRADEVDELSPEQTKRDRRIPRSSLEEKDVRVEEETIEESVEAEEINDQEAATILKKNRDRRISRNVSAAESPDLDEVTEPTPPIIKKKGTKARQVSIPATQRHPKSSNEKVKNKIGAKNSKKSSKASQVRMGSPIPVTVHRLTKRVVIDENLRDSDILNADIPYAKRGGVNPIDVLSQVCQEIIGSGLSTLEEGRANSDDPALRREYSTKWRAVEAFGKELQTRLLEHAVNLDNTFSLQRRVRDQQKKKLALRGNILRIRAEREQVALRMDEIRIRHEKESKSARERDGLNNDIHDIELAIERGRSKHPTGEPIEMDGIELGLQRIAEKVSNKSDSGGMLKQIKEFNAFLERAALVLEGTK